MPNYDARTGQRMSLEVKLGETCGEKIGHRRQNGNLLVCALSVKQTDGFWLSMELDTKASFDKSFRLFLVDFNYLLF